MSENLIEGLQRECERVREIIREYDKIPTGAFAAAMMRHDIKAAETAMATGDTAGMVRGYASLKDYEL